MEPPARRSRRPTAVVAVAAGGVAVLPLVVATVVLSQRRWFPALDVTMIHLRVRDVFSTHPPQLGIPGRFGGTLDDPGSHPGPLAFYLLAPVYRVFGASTWSLQVACVALHIVAVGLAGYIGWRRCRLAGAFAVVLATALVVWSFGPLVLTQPWNPYQPTMAWLLVVVAVWAVTCGDDAMLYPAIAAGTLAAQMHLSYLPGVAVLVGFAGALVVRRAPRRVVGPALLGAVLWVPVAVEQARKRPGNLTKLWEEIVTGDGARVGWWGALRAAVARFDVVAVIGGNTARMPELTPSAWRGVVALIVWGAVSAWSWRRAPTELLRLHATLALAGAVGVVAIARVIGPLWPYLTLWAWVNTALVVVAVGWSAAVIVGRRARWPIRARRRVAVAVAGAALASASVASTISYARAPVPEPAYSELAAGLADPVLDALRGGAGLARGEGDGAASGYVMTIYDSFDPGSVAFSLLAHLERHGVEVGVLPHYEPFVGAHRVGTFDDAGAQVVVATGGWVDAWREIDGAIEIAAVDTRTQHGRAAHAAARLEAIEALRGAGLEDLVELVDTALFGLLLNADIPPEAADALGVMAGLGRHAAVFVAPVDLRPT